MGGSGGSISPKFINFSEMSREAAKREYIFSEMSREAAKREYLLSPDINLFIYAIS